MARSLAPDIRDAIERAAREEGVDPSFALAVAERESSFNPRAHSSQTIHGLFQMMEAHRSRYGVGNSEDPYTQAKGWARFIKDEKAASSRVAGREISDTESYASHHFGSGRAGRMFKMDPSTPVNEIFTRREMSENPHFAKAGTVGNLLSEVTGDIQKRQAKFGGAAGGPIDFASYGEAVDSPYDLGGKTDMAAQAPDFAGSSEGANLNMGSAPAASSAPDFSNFGVPVS